MIVRCALHAAVLSSVSQDTRVRTVRYVLLSDPAAYSVPTSSTSMPTSSASLPASGGPAASVAARAPVKLLILQAFQQERR